jgi:hypothetical protein
MTIQYLEISVEERKSHLDLNEDCLERGGSSTQHRGVLAQFLNTPIFNRPADLCHACSNPLCSNPKHLYWGTRRENVRDAINEGTFKSPFECQVEKYGYEEACRRNGLGNKRAGGKANKGKKKSEEHKKNISQSLKNNTTN